MFIFHFISLIGFNKLLRMISISNLNKLEPKIDAILYFNPYVKMFNSKPNFLMIFLINCTLILSN